LQIEGVIIDFKTYSNQMNIPKDEDKIKIIRDTIVKNSGKYEIKKFEKLIDTFGIVIDQNFMIH